jgi:hypothetical protein
MRSTASPDMPFMAFVTSFEYCLKRNAILTFIKYYSPFV